MTIKEKLEDLNQMVLNGQVLEAFDKYYHEEVVMSENNQDPLVGKTACRQKEEAFVNGLTAFRGAEVKNVAIGEGVSMVEWFFDYSHKDWGDRTYNQVAVQEWKDGQIIRETFYYGA